eukprot:CAMPEP_0115745424 /NCGR_PEP_ID=MMETSP0272-20121206/92114_1 /TAXON_ID=71861 /ORGANISM="Scrippsiella trochoidea, Strain CCMP3099" /LENGTH=210 /DNA_ID=CAMNT_0003190333 /DNA_START=399 /DNA_END=1031 /DNA_ORIENTATION=-
MIGPVLMILVRWETPDTHTMCIATLSAWCTSNLLPLEPWHQRFMRSIVSLSNGVDLGEDSPASDNIPGLPTSVPEVAHAEGVAQAVWGGRRGVDPFTVPAFSACDVNIKTMLEDGQSNFTRGASMEDPGAPNLWHALHAFGCGEQLPKDLLPFTLVSSPPLQLLARLACDAILARWTLCTCNKPLAPGAPSNACTMSSTSVSSEIPESKL